ncbi:unnamed protein product, partial [Phaeothamnion confervicola]
MAMLEPFRSFERMDCGAVRRVLELMVQATQMSNKDGPSIPDISKLLHSINVTEILLCLNAKLAAAQRPEAVPRMLEVVGFVVDEVRVEEDSASLKTALHVVLGLLQRYVEAAAGGGGGGSDAAPGGSGGGAGGEGSNLALSPEGWQRRRQELAVARAKKTQRMPLEEVVTLLGRVLTRCLSTPGGCQELGPHLPLLAATLVAAFVDLRAAAAAVAPPGFVIAPTSSGLGSPGGGGVGGGIGGDEDGNGEAGGAAADAEAEEEALKSEQRSVAFRDADAAVCLRVALRLRALLASLVTDAPPELDAALAQLDPSPIPDGTHGLRGLRNGFWWRRIRVASRTAAAAAASGTGGIASSAAAAEAGARAGARAADTMADTIGGGARTPAELEAALRKLVGQLEHGAATRSAIALTTSMSHIRRLLSSSGEAWVALARDDGGGGGIITVGAAAEDDGAGGGISRSRGSAAIEALLFAVLQVLQSEHPAAIHEDAARLLGEIGAVDPYHIHVAAAANKQPGPNEAAGAPHSDPLMPTKLRALKMLATYLTDRDASVSMRALWTLKAVLSRDADKRCFLRATEGTELHALLLPFYSVRANVRKNARAICRMRRETVDVAGAWAGGSAGGGDGGSGDGDGGAGGFCTGGGCGRYRVDAADGEDPARLPPAFSEQVWGTSGKTFGRWVRCLTSSLLAECYAEAAEACFTPLAAGIRVAEAPAESVAAAGGSRGGGGDARNSIRWPVQGSIYGRDEFLALCAAMCGRKAAFAAALFPALVYDLVREEANGLGGIGGRSGARARLSSRFRSMLRPLRVSAEDEQAIDGF